MNASAKRLWADGCCRHGVLVSDTCFDCEVREVAEAEQRAKRKHARETNRYLNAKYSKGVER